MPVRVLVIRDRELDRQARVKPCEIAPGKRLAALGEFVQALHLSEADPCGDVGEVRLSAEHVDIHAVFAGSNHALQTQLFAGQGVLGIGQHDCTAFGRGDVLVGVKTECDQIAEGADPLAFPEAAQCLRRILEHPQPVLCGDRVQPVHVHRQPGEVDRNDRSRCRRDRRFHEVQVDVAGCRIDIHEHRPRAHRERDVRGSYPGQRRRDHLVSRADIRHSQADFKRGGRRTEDPHCASAAVTRQLGFEGFGLRSGGDPARTKAGSSRCHLPEPHTSAPFAEKSSLVRR